MVKKVFSASRETIYFGRGTVVVFNQALVVVGFGFGAVVVLDFTFLALDRIVGFLGRLALALRLTLRLFMALALA